MAETADGDTDKTFGAELKERVSGEVLAETIHLGLYALRTNGFTGQPEPDWPTRHKFSLLAAQYLIGKPLERKELDATQAGRSLEDMKDLAKRSPTFRASLIRLLEDVIESTAT